MYGLLHQNNHSIVSVVDEVIACIIIQLKTSLQSPCRFPFPIEFVASKQPSKAPQTLSKSKNLRARFVLQMEH